MTYVVEYIQREMRLRSIAAVCQLFGVKASWLNKLMNSNDVGRFDPRRSTMLKDISKRAHVSIEWLMCGTGDAPAEIQLEALGQRK